MYNSYNILKAFQDQYCIRVKQIMCVDSNIGIQVFLVGNCITFNLEKTIGTSINSWISQTHNNYNRNLIEWKVPYFKLECPSMVKIKCFIQPRQVWNYVMGYSPCNNNGHHLIILFKMEHRVGNICDFYVI